MSLQIHKDIIRLIKNKYVRNIAIVMHTNPDGDCIGSAVALEETLKQMGKKVDIITHSKIDKKFAPIIGKKRVDKIFLPYEDKNYDIAFILDVSDFNRTYYDIKFKARKIVIIDHHPVNKIPNVNYYLNNNDSSTGITVYNLIKEFCEMNSKIATAIYLTIKDDTDNFSNSNISSETFAILTELLKYDIDIHIVNEICSNITLSYIKLLSIVLPQVKVENNKLLYLMITKNDIKESGSNYKEAGMVIDLLKFVNKIEISMLFIEGDKNIIIKARSKSFPINTVIEFFGGGGHKCSAGCIVKSDDIYATKNKVINKINETFK